MLKEPRGLPSSCLNLVLPPLDEAADAAFIIMEQSRYYPAMSGSNTMCVVTVLLETGWLPMREPMTELRLETPAGLIDVQATCDSGRVRSVTLRNVPSFATHLDEPLHVPGVGDIRVDVAYGGMFYVLVSASDLGVDLASAQGAELVRVGELVKQSARRNIAVAHPTFPEIDVIECTLIHGPPKAPANDGRNAVIVSTGDPEANDSAPQRASIDRSPCGTGTSARLAVLHARGELGVDADYRHEGILDTVFTGRIVDTAPVGPHTAIVPSISGQAWITGYADYVLADDDPFPEGFTVGDIWPG
jgi:proline racemase